MKRFSICLLLLAVLFTGCTSGYMTEQSGTAISAVQDSSAVSTSSSVALYFRYYDEPMLARTNITVDTGQQQLKEYYAISALLNGPSVQHPELSACFGTNTKLVTVSGNGNCLYVTLSEGFFQDTTGTSDSITSLKRRLAVYSIVNTVCEMGNYSQVQLYVYRDQTPQRPTSLEMGLANSTGDTQPLGPLTRDVDYILTPANVVKTALSCYAEQEYSRLYYYLGTMTGDTVTLPIVEEQFAQQLSYMDLVMTEHTINTNYTVDSTASTALVQISFKIRNKSAVYSVSNVPLKLFSSNQCWKISYADFMQYLEVTS